MVTILKALALIPIGYALGLGVYFAFGLPKRHSLSSIFNPEPPEVSPVSGLIGLVIIIVMIIGMFLVKIIDDYPANLYTISILIGMIIYGVKKFIKEFWYLWRKPRE